MLLACGASILISLSAMFGVSMVTLCGAERAVLNPSNASVLISQMFVRTVYEIIFSWFDEAGVNLVCVWFSSSGGVAGTTGREHAASWSWPAAGRSVGTHHFGHGPSVSSVQLPPAVLYSDRCVDTGLELI